MMSTYNIILFLVSILFMWMFSHMISITNMLNMIIEIKLSFNTNPNSILSISFNNMTMIFSMLVIIITLSIIMFSQSYMATDKFLPQFYKIMLLFVSSMLIMIMSMDMVTLFIGWDGLGITSFLLVAYYSSPSSMSGALITLLSNRFGDGLMIMFISMTMSYNHMTLIYHKLETFFLIIMASITKSAQLPFSLWLPEAMAAPTPISSLVHSSTLVTAGIFLLIRYWESLHKSNWSQILLFLSLWTSLFGAMIGATMKDSKKIVAISTLSQLGLMCSSLSIGLPSLTFFHLITHASFKALLFTTIGMDIMLSSHSQMLIIKKKLFNILDKAKLVSLSSMNAFPFTAGYMSKDSILELIETSEKMESFLIIYLATAFTFLYSMRLWKANMINNNMNSKLSSNSNHMIPPFIILSMFSITLGVSFSFISLPYYLPPHSTLEHLLPISTWLMGLIFLIPNYLPIKPMSFLSKSMWLLSKPTKKSMNFMSLSYYMILSSEISMIESLSPLYMKIITNKFSNLFLTSQMMSFKKMLYLSLSMFLLYFLWI